MHLSSDFVNIPIMGWIYISFIRRWCEWLPFTSSMTNRFLMVMSKKTFLLVCFFNKVGKIFLWTRAVVTCFQCYGVIHVQMRIYKIRTCKLTKYDYKMEYFPSIMSNGSRHLPKFRYQNSHVQIYRTTRSRGTFATQNWY